MKYRYSATTKRFKFPDEPSYFREAVGDIEAESKVKAIEKVQLLYPQRKIKVTEKQTSVGKDQP